MVFSSRITRASRARVHRRTITVPRLLFFSCSTFIPPYTLSVTFSPKRPVGFTTRMTINRAKVKASEKTDQLEPLMMLSEMPIRKAPTTAPGMEPMPPNTAATKARSPGSAPERGTMDW